MTDMLWSKIKSYFKAMSSRISFGFLFLPTFFRIWLVCLEHYHMSDWRHKTKQLTQLATKMHKGLYVGVGHTHFWWSCKHRCTIFLVNQRLAKSQLMPGSVKIDQEIRAECTKPTFLALPCPLLVVMWPRVHNLFVEPASRQEPSLY